MFPVMFIVSAVLFVVGYKFYGDFMAGVYGLDNKTPTPSERLNDGIDYCPAHPAVVLGHHFSSIAGAGPIVGPITAASIFGWLPTIIWCVLGSIFLGGPHDMGSLVSSMRHDGKSVGTVIERWIGETGKKLFLGFTILSDTGRSSLPGPNNGHFCHRPGSCLCGLHVYPSCDDLRCAYISF